MLSKEQLKDLVGRAAWTALQAFVAVWLVSDQPFSKQAVIAGVAASISALKTFVISTQ